MNSRHLTTPRGELGHRPAWLHLIFEGSASVDPLHALDGRLYQTPVNVFATEDGYVIVLTYGPDTDWVKNVLAASGCELRARGQVIRLVSPRLFHDQARRDIRPLERQVLRVLGVADFLSLETAPAAVPAAGQS